MCLIFANMRALALDGYVLSLLLFLLIYYVILRIMKRVKEIRALPPGPYGVPFLGYVPFMKCDILKQVDSLKKVYGERFSISILSRDYIILNDPDDIIAALRNKNVLDRPSEVCPRKTGVAVSVLNGLEWINSREVVFKLLRKSEIDRFVTEEVENFVRALIDDKSANLADLISLSSSNLVYILLIGRCIRYADSEEKKLFSLLMPTVAAYPSLLAVRNIPFLCDILSLMRVEPFRSITEFDRLVDDHIEKEVKVHRNSDQANNYDLIDVFLEGSSCSRVSKTFSNESLLAIFVELLAGSTGIANLLHWILLFMVKYPDYQSRIRNEIRSAVGSRKISYEDQSLVPLLQAFIYESLRAANILPIALPRYTSDDTLVNDFFIPKNTRVIMITSNLLSSPRIYHRPERFYPERFLSKDGKLEVPRYFIPFLTGKRDCPGKDLSQRALFTYSARLIQTFIIEACEPSENVCDLPTSSINRWPKKMPTIKLRTVNDLGNFQSRRDSF